jgi:hypothetical protein
LTRRTAGFRLARSLAGGDVHSRSAAESRSRLSGRYAPLVAATPICVGKTDGRRTVGASCKAVLALKSGRRRSKFLRPPSKPPPPASTPQVGRAPSAPRRPRPPTARLFRSASKSADQGPGAGNSIISIIPSISSFSLAKLEPGISNISKSTPDSRFTPLENSINLTIGR